MSVTNRTDTPSTIPKLASDGQAASTPVEEVTVKVEQAARKIDKEPKGIAAKAFDWTLDKTLGRAIDYFIIKRIPWP